MVVLVTMGSTSMFEYEVDSEMNTTGAFWEWK